MLEGSGVGKAERKKNNVLLGKKSEQNQWGEDSRRNYSIQHAKISDPENTVVTPVWNNNRVFTAEILLFKEWSSMRSPGQHQPLEAAAVATLLGKHLSCVSSAQVWPIAAPHRWLKWCPDYGTHLRHLNLHQKLTRKNVHRQLHKQWAFKYHCFAGATKTAPSVGSQLHTHRASTSYGTPTPNCLPQMLSQPRLLHTFQQALQAICQYFNSFIESSCHHKPNQPAKLVSSIQVLKKLHKKLQ